MSEAKEIHAYYCFDILKNYLAVQEKPKYRDSDVDSAGESSALSSLFELFENKEYPLFVTWTTDRRGADELRGCIGTFSPTPLHSGLRDYALVSALRDTRFSPIKSTELPDLSCSVSLLVNFEQAKDCFDWEVGTHGIRIAFKDQTGRACSSTYLPEVAVEQGWDKEETLRSLMYKGGFRGDISAADLKNVQLTRYQSHKVKVTFAQYQDCIFGKAQ